MARYEDLVPSVAIHVSPCPEQAIIDAVKHVVRNFCKETKGWVFDVPAIPVDANNIGLDFALDVPDSTTVIYIWGVNGRNGQYGDSDNYSFTHPNLLSFKKPPVSMEIKPIVSLMPSRTSEEYPDYLDEYFDKVLVSGAVAYLQMQPFRAWSQPNAAGVHQQQYLEGIAVAKSMRDSGLNIAKIKRRVRAQYI